MATNIQVKEEIELEMIKCSTTFTTNPSSQDETEKTSNKENFRSRYLGIGFGILSALCAWASSIIVKLLKGYSASEIISYRMAIDVIILLPFLIHKREKFGFSSQIKNITFRGILLAIAYFSYVYALKNLPIAESNAITFGHPMFTAIVSKIILKNKFSNVKFIALFLNIIGLILVTHFWTGMDTERALGITFAFLYLFSYATAQMVLKKLSLDMNPQMIVFHMSWMRLTYMLMFTEISNNFTMPRLPKCDYGTSFLSEPMLLFSMAIFLMGFGIFAGKSMQLETPTTVSAIATSIQLPLFIIGQWFVFNNAPSTGVVIGVLAVLLTSWILNLDAIADKLSEKSCLKRCVKWINKGINLDKVNKINWVVNRR